MTVQIFRSDAMDVALDRKAKLIYLDPPFASQRNYLHSDGRLAFTDKWPSMEAYLKWLERVLLNLKSLLDGSIVVHVDSRASAYVRVMGDRVFGQQAFASEIIWRYRRWPSKTNNFQRVHDTLLRWTSGAETWNQLYEPLSASTIKTFGSKKQRAVFSGGKRQRSSTVEEDSLGTPLGDVWDIPIVAPIARERTGYPTQKPEALLERLILALTNECDLVLDPMCGSGTTLAVATRLQRDSIGCDLSAIAIEVASARLGGLINGA